MKLGFGKLWAVPKHLHLGINRTKKVHDDFDTLKLQASRHQKELQDTAELLHSVSKDYEQLEAAYYGLLQLMAETLLKQEMLLTSLETANETKHKLEEALKQHDVERFSPLVGDGIPADKCKVVGQVETDRFFAGSVARIVSVGFRIKKDSRLLVLPVVLESVAPSVKPQVQGGSADRQTENNKGERDEHSGL